MELIENPNSVDILFCGGRVFHGNHRGCSDFLKLIRKRRTDFLSTFDGLSKIQLASSLVHYLRDSDMLGNKERRFLQLHRVHHRHVGSDDMMMDENGYLWIEMDHESSTKRTMHYLESNDVEHKSHNVKKESTNDVQRHVPTEILTETFAHFADIMNSHRDVQCEQQGVIEHCNTTGAVAGDINQNHQHGHNLHSTGNRLFIELTTSGETTVEQSEPLHQVVTPTEEDDDYDDEDDDELKGSGNAAAPIILLTDSDDVETTSSVGGSESSPSWVILCPGSFEDSSAGVTTANNASSVISSLSCEEEDPDGDDDDDAAVISSLSCEEEDSDGDDDDDDAAAEARKRRWLRSNTDDASDTTCDYHQPKRQRSH